MVPEDGELLLTDLDRAAAELYMMSVAIADCKPPQSPYHGSQPSLLFVTHLWNQDAVSSLYAHCYPLAVLVHQTRANSQHLGLVQLLDRRLGKVDSASSLGLHLRALDEHAVEKGRERFDGFDGGRLCVSLLDLTRVAERLMEEICLPF